MPQTYLQLLEESLPDSNHPAYHFWKKYALNAIERGKEVVWVIEKYTPVKDKKILDVGCGEGGASIAFAKENALVTAIDIDPARIRRTQVRAEEHNVNITAVLGDINKTDFPNGYFDVIVCQDVIEHVLSPGPVIAEISRILKNGGYLFLTAPNRLSPLNFIRDPHYNLFGISLLPRRLAAFYTVKIRRRTSNYSVGNLPTLKWLKDIFSTKGLSFQVNLPSEERVKRFFQKNSGFERHILKIFSRMGLIVLLMKAMKQSWYQFFIAPSWKLVCVKDRKSRD